LPLSITVTLIPLTVTTTSLPSATPGVPYSVKLAADGGLTPYSWSITQGSLPAGLKVTYSATGPSPCSPTKASWSKNSPTPARPAEVVSTTPAPRSRNRHLGKSEVTGFGRGHGEHRGAGWQRARRIAGR
jgi:hypothetical protein